MTMDASAGSVAPAAGVDEVDRINAEFYGEIRYPWPPLCFETLDDPRFWAAAVDHDLGRRGRPVLPPGGGRVWVAGCGTNQAVITALMFPGARVVGSDLSAGSLEVAERSARQLGVTNLELRRESIHAAAYDEEFDYVICTGVVHHSAEPARTLGHLAAALRPAGVMQLMVYNRFHRTLTTAFQAVVRTLLGGGGYEYAGELALARRFVQHYQGAGPMPAWLAQYRSIADEQLADSLIQPVEHSYTVESLDALARGAGLELLAPFPNGFDAANGTLHWEAALGDAELQRAYDALPDLRRWQVTNLLLQGDSPMLWFYLQRDDSPVPRRTTRELCDEFLATRFAPARTVRRLHLADADGGYRSAPDQEAAFPVWRGKGDLRRVYEAADGRATMGEVLARLGISTDVPTVSRLRVSLASSAFPYLRPV